jgi:hypothetical protein
MSIFLEVETCGISEAGTTNAKVEVAIRARPLVLDDLECV